MMKVYKYPIQSKWTKLAERPGNSDITKEAVVKSLLENVKKNGDKALIELTKKLDKVSISSVKVDEKAILEAEKNVTPALKRAIGMAYKNIYKFHAAQIKNIENKIETVPGVLCWRKSVPIEKTGLYIPGGSAPLFSTVLMLGIPAKIAGCKEIVLCSPPPVHPAILYTTGICGIRRIFSVGGAQAIGAMAYGTKTIPKVDKIFGPGNSYVTLAKQMVSREGIAIDMPAGPSEVLIIADSSSNPKFVAADLLSQAEHGPDSQVILLSESQELIHKVLKELAVQLATLSRKNIAEKALKNSRAVLFKTLNDCLHFSNFYAPEHLILCCRNSNMLAEKVTNAGSVFIGEYSPESAGDYASGTNHTLPTNGYAKAYSGVSADSFMKSITFQKISREGLISLGATIETMAEAEQLTAHKNAVTVRLNEIIKAKNV
jgi:histidinol dehydrogenase